MRIAISLGLCTLLSSVTAMAQPVQGQVTVGGQVMMQPAAQPMLPAPQGQVYVQQQPMMQPIMVQQQPIFVRPPPPPGQGLLVGGAVTFGVLYGVSLLTGSVALGINYPEAQFGGAMLFIPVVGPFVTAAVWAPVGTPLMILNGLGQGAGLAMLIAGAVINANARPAQAQPMVTGSRDRSEQRRATNHIDWNISPVASPMMTGAVLNMTTF